MAVTTVSFPAHSRPTITESKKKRNDKGLFVMAIGAKISSGRSPSHENFWKRHGVKKIIGYVALLIASVTGNIYISVK